MNFDFVLEDESLRGILLQGFFLTAAIASLPLCKQPRRSSLHSVLGTMNRIILLMQQTSHLIVAEVDPVTFARWAASRAADQVEKP